MEITWPEVFMRYGFYLFLICMNVIALSHFRKLYKRKEDDRKL